MSVSGLSAVQARIAELQGIGGAAGPVARSGAFAAQLAGAQATQAGSTVGTSSALPTTPYGGWSAPGATGGVAGTAPGARAAGTAAELARLAAFGNGRIPKAELAEIGVGSHRMAAPAAEAFQRLRAAAQAAGVKVGVTDSYRSYEAQVDVARRKGLYSQGGLAARPGTSDHGWGLSLDLDLNPKAQAWMRANAGRFGFAEDVPREPWHWTFQP